MLALNESPALFLPVLIGSISRTVSSVPSGISNVFDGMTLGADAAGAGASAFLVIGFVAAGSAAVLAGAGWTSVADACSAVSFEQPTSVQVTATTSNTYHERFIVSPQ